ncbi:mandelate racemase/muconate lactonizing enzyme family protein [Caballeronia sp. LZ034LL]|uniref:mandelate racemase/muconate lactonizing enzyme family protein n=1 Tax=Caballeronia sp. LZ034LL TaxID=3038567 RepID=UPI002854EE8D|nr:mandelate racemase/muconate lactonizing enzyme family protein [Caballeronia sp. LZ034LL]MDR5839129.1 mandelate racemase/muconate lactonizing enzyme family protein [Caballeronia sp. LZ034LL]
MKIRTIRSYVLRVPLGDKLFYSSQAAFPERNSYLVRIETDTGLVGWGEGGQYGPPEPVAACIDHVLAPKLIGRDPTEPVRIWEELYNFSRDFGQKGTYVEAISALDIALWDIAGQSAGLPVWKMLGGRFRESVPAYATGCYYPQDYSRMSELLRSLEAEASSYADAGFEMLKVKIGLLSLKDDIERLRVIRAAVGPDIAMLVDANHAYNATSAIRMGRLMEPLDVRFFEEPVVPEDKAGYRRVRAENPVPVAGGECEFTRYGFAELIGTGCVDIAQPDLAVCGGFTAFKQILAFASTHGVGVIPHVWGSGIAVAAALQAIATIPPIPHTANPIALQNEPIVEFDRKHNPLRDDLLDQRFALVEGRLAVPDAPGLGVTVNEAALQRFSVQ